jgi:hypothetical protein
MLVSKTEVPLVRFLLFFSFSFPPHFLFSLLLHRIRGNCKQLEFIFFPSFYRFSWILPRPFPPIFAKFLQREKLMQVILSKKPNLEVQEAKHQATPLYMAVANNCTEAVNLLIAVIIIL